MLPSKSPFKLAYMQTSYQLFSPVSTAYTSFPEPCCPAPQSLCPVSKRLCCPATLLPASSSAALSQSMLTSRAPGLWSGSPASKFHPCAPTSSPASCPTFRGVSFSGIFDPCSTGKLKTFDSLSQWLSVVWCWVSVEGIITEIDEYKGVITWREGSLELSPPKEWVYIVAGLEVVTEGL